MAELAGLHSTEPPQRRRDEGLQAAVLSVMGVLSEQLPLGW